MLKKLRNRFVCVLMALVTAMLCIIFAFLYHNTRANLEEQSLTMMRSVAQNPFRLGHPGNDSEPVRLPCFVLRISSHGEIVTASGGYYDLTDTVFLEGLIDRVLACDEDQGAIPEYGLRFLKVKSPSALALVFADTTSETATLHTLARTCLLIGSLCLGVFFGIAWLLARWMVQPVEKAWEQQRQFVSDASHELKTPLTVILTNAELLLAPDTEPQARKTCADSILTMSHQMRDLVEQLLELARNDNGTVRMERSELDYSALTEDGLLPFEAVFYERGLFLETDITPGIVLTGSRRYLGQVLDILLDNARKYAAFGTVKVNLAPWGKRHCRLTVSNTCEALTPEELKSIFKRFYRRDEARCRDGSFGLGLSIAEEIVQAHGGRIWAQWREGMITFTVELPVKTFV